MNKVCVIFTVGYPFGAKETFLETELLYISKYFDQIFICTYDGNSTARFIPSNAHVEGLNIANSKFRRSKKMLKGIFSRKIGKTPKSFRKKLQFVYANGNAKVLASFAIKKLKKHLKPSDSVVFYSYWLNEPASAAILVYKHFKKIVENAVVVSRAHGYDLYSERNWNNYLPLQEYNVQNIDKVFACSEFGCNYLQSKYPSFKDKIGVSRLGVINSYGISSNVDSGTPFHFVTCSSLSDVKRVDLFANVFCELIKRGLDVKWTCIGDGPEKQKVLDIISSNNCSNKVNFTGWISNEEIYSFYVNEKIDCFVNVSSSEGVPVAIMEALSFGIPCFASSVGGIPELINENNGLLLDANYNVDKIVDLIINQVLPRFRNNDMRICARNTWKQLCDADVCYNNFYKQLEELL